MDKKEIIEKLTPIVRDVFADSTIQIMDEMDAENVEAKVRFRNLPGTVIMCLHRMCRHHLLRAHISCSYW